MGGCVFRHRQQWMVASTSWYNNGVVFFGIDSNELRLVHADSDQRSCELLQLSQTDFSFWLYTFLSLQVLGGQVHAGCLHPKFGLCLDTPFLVKPSSITYICHFPTAVWLPSAVLCWVIKSYMFSVCMSIRFESSYH